MLSWVRAATLRVYLDTPWRFRSAKALWKYLGIGLERRRSGNGPEMLGVPLQVNRLLKSTILGAARSAIAQGANPFADQQRRWIEQGLTAKLARRNVARRVVGDAVGPVEKRRRLPSRVGGSELGRNGKEPGVELA
jgi:hypothetical protein